MEKFIKKLSERKKNDFDEIVGHFEEISDRNSEILDKPLQYEYNFFRAFSFIGDAEKIIPSLNFDEDINPLNTTSNKPDLIIEYKDFILVVEVTLSAGQRQYESEGAPVFRHVGKCQNENDKPVFGLFICEKMDVNMPIEFLSRAMVKTKIYNGRVRILPIERSDFNLLFKKIYNEELKSDYLFG
ncbi:MAG: AlwI family type II restriction endonuclease, partial [Flavobacteriaceae bacterium]